MNHTLPTARPRLTAVPDARPRLAAVPDVEPATAAEVALARAVLSGSVVADREEDALAGVLLDARARLCALLTLVDEGTLRSA